MQVSANVILSDFGTTLPLDRRRKDALAAFARKSAWADGARSAQRWVELRWGLKDYEAKDLLKGNASEAVWERIVKHPNGGWAVTLPIMGAVIGVSLEDWLSARLAEEHERLNRDRERYEAERARAVEMASTARALVGAWFGPAGSSDPGASGLGGQPRRRLGDQEARAAVNDDREP